MKLTYIAPAAAAVVVVVVVEASIAYYFFNRFKMLLARPVRVDTS
jgi:hypothetical protein